MFFSLAQSVGPLPALEPSIEEASRLQAAKLRALNSNTRKEGIKGSPMPLVRGARISGVKHKNYNKLY